MYIRAIVIQEQTMKRMISTAAVFGLAVVIFAYGTMAKVAQETYKYGADSEAAKAKCSLCHVSKMGGKLNPYGTDLKGATGGSKTLTAAMLKAVEAKDSDGDGKSNGAELKAGGLPGVK
jgi:hypothetical protein